MESGQCTVKQRSNNKFKNSLEIQVLTNLKFLKANVNLYQSLLNSLITLLRLLERT